MYILTDEFSIRKSLLEADSFAHPFYASSSIRILTEPPRFEGRSPKPPRRFHRK